MSKIKLKSLKFEDPAFRKLRNIEIPFADRMTIIAGHNGIGKSTILGLVANGSGLNQGKYQSYLGRMFVANLYEIIHLDYDAEFLKYRQQQAALPSPFLEYDIDGTPLRKRCSITSRASEKQVRVVPRNEPYSDFAGASGIQVGQDAKVPLPTLYLGMTRMLPVGESIPASVTNSIDKNFDPSDASFLQNFIANVIDTGLNSQATGQITTQSIKGTNKTAKHPEYTYSTKCISLGQDSLSSIATALASFKKLKREWSDYPGGLLVIDEIDAGFHPHAQHRLIAELGKAARNLDLQIIATTHSMCIIEAVHPDSKPQSQGKYVDSVVYITDTVQPRIAESYPLAHIRDDMNLVPPGAKQKSKRRELKIYLEDPETYFFITKLLTRTIKMRITREFDVTLKPIPLSVGCENLKGFHKHDPYFTTALIALDADSTIPKSKKGTKNIIKLPGAKNEHGGGLSPERTLYKFIQTLAEKNDSYPTARAQLNKQRVTSDQLKAHLLKGDWNLTNRESAKKWMTAKLDLIEQWKLVELWIKEHPVEVNTFNDALASAAKDTAKRL